MPEPEPAAEPGAAAASPPVPEARPRPPGWVLPTALVPIIAVLIAGWIAGVSWARLIDEGRPLLLIALSPINRFLLLTTNDLDFWSYFGVGLGRHLFPDPFFFLLGHWYGARALKWASEAQVAQRLVGVDGRGLENPAHRKILYPLAFVIPNNYVSLLCGAARIPVASFVVLNVTGTIGRLALCRWLGAVFAEEIRTITDFIGEYQWAITVVSVVVVAIGISAQLRPNGQIRKLARLNQDD